MSSTILDSLKGDLSSISLVSLKGDLRGYGLDDPELLEVTGFACGQDVLDALYPGRPVALAADAIVYLDRLLLEVSSKARLARRLEDRGITPSQRCIVGRG